MERREEGSKLLCLLRDYVALDIETTGFHPHKDEIIEVAAAKVQNGILSDTFTSLINPHVRLRPDIVKLTGITDTMLYTAPEASTVLYKLVKFVGNHTIVAHNARFDMGFITHHCAKHLDYDFQNDYVDTLRMSRMLFPKEKGHKLENVCKRLGVDELVEHRALSDTLQLVQCCERLKEMLRGDQAAADRTFGLVQENKPAPLLGKSYAFAGTIANQTRAQTAELVTAFGGQYHENVILTTDYLVISNQAAALTESQGCLCTKHAKAERLRIAGRGIQIITEEQFYQMLEQSPLHT